MNPPVLEFFQCSSAGLGIQGMLKGGSMDPRGSRDVGWATALTFRPYLDDHTGPPRTGDNPPLRTDRSRASGELHAQQSAMRRGT